ncbi:hypothetical protein MMC09_001098 [Bachmanniomyces sp. S44760]|nr:hypothetical protein [Bachmanniomyces sp. S44760]
MNVVRSHAKSVFAHFMVGNVYSYTEQTWANDIATAKAAHIDGFALNIGPDSYTETQVGYAFAAAEKAQNFTLFISFDYSREAWTTNQVTTLVDAHSSSPAQFRYGPASKPFVSTFTGESAADPAVIDWKAINEKYYFVPSWTSLGDGIKARLDEIAGILPWSAWPTYPAPMDTTNDELWKSRINSGGDAKTYMMAVSPWFYANCYGKNWVWSAGDLWYERWQEVIELQPDLVEILTWNDYGESHYIGPLPITDGGYPTGAQDYAADMPHTGFLDMLPYYIDAYKSGNTTASQITEEQILHYHRPSPANVGNPAGTVANAVSQGQPVAPPTAASPDQVNFDVLVKQPSDVSVQIGSGAPTQLKAKTAGVNHFSVPFNGQTGKVTYTISRGGQTILSTTGQIADSPTPAGNTNWNAIVGSAKTS